MKKHLAKNTGITGLASLLFMTSALPASAGSAEDVLNELFPEKETAEAEISPALFNQQLENELYLSFEENPDEAALGLFDEDGLLGEMKLEEEEKGFNWSFELLEDEETIELDLEDGRYFIGSLEDSDVTYASFIHLSEQPELDIEEETLSGTASSPLEDYGLSAQQLELTMDSKTLEDAEEIHIEIAEDGTFSIELPEITEDAEYTFRLLDPAGNETETALELSAESTDEDELSEENAVNDEENTEEDTVEEDSSEESSEENAVNEEENTEEDAVEEDASEESSEENAVNEEENTEEDASEENGTEDRMSTEEEASFSSFSTFSTFTTDNDSTYTYIGDFYDGAAGEYIRDLKLDLTNLGFGNFPSSPSDRFGPVTMGVVEDFQRAYGLKTDGLPTNEMLDMMKAELNGELKALSQTSTSIGEFYDGASGEYIRDLKIDLTNLGFGNFPSSPSANFGPVTMGVVEDFQRAYGLETTGLPTEEMLTLIEEELKGSFYDGASGDYIRDLKLDLTKLGFGNFPSSPSANFGPVTMGVVEDFQRAHGLSVTGIPDQHTLDAVAQALKTAFYDGASGEHIRDLKHDLTNLGFGNFPSSPSANFGPVTMGVVEDFQRAHGLSVTGIPDQPTLDAVAQALKTAFYDGASGEHIRDLKINLTNLGFGNFPSSPSANFGSVTMGVVEDFQRAYSLPATGIPDQFVLDTITEALKTAFYEGASGEHVRELKRDLTDLGYGNFPSNPSNSYGSVTANVVRDFQSSNGLVASGIADDSTLEAISKMLNEAAMTGVVTATSLNVRSGPSTSYGIVGSLANGTAVSIIGEQSGWYRIIFNGGTAFVSGSLVNTSSTPDPGSDFNGPNQIAYTNGASLNVRSGPGSSHRVIDNLGSNTRVEVLSTRGSGSANSWHQIRYDGSKTGYVSAGYVQFASKSSAASGPLAGRTVVLDAGHGGHDPGAVSGSLRESDVVLDVSLRAEELLREAGAEVIMIRRTDIFLSLSQRAFVANRSGADAFLSVHTNAFNGTAHGTETFWNNRFQASNSQRLAQQMQINTVAKMGTHSRRVDQANFTVIRSTQIPSALLEIAFTDHPTDGHKLRQDSYRERAAEAIRDGFIGYFN